MRLRRASLRLAAAIALALAACGEAPPETGESAAASPHSRLVVYTVNEPLRYFAARIGGDHVEALFPAPPGADPAFWSPDPETVAAYQRADLVLLNGAGYASWIDRATLHRKRLIDTSAAFSDRLLPRAKAATHRHGPEGAHSHRELAITTWLDPALAIEQARSIADTFSRKRPEGEADFRSNFSALAAELHDLDARLAQAARSLGDAPLLFSHPVYQYLVARYGLNARSLHWEPDRVPDAEQWRTLEVLRKTHPARWMLWESAPLPETEQRLASFGVASRVYDPCGNTPETEDFLAVLHRNVRALESIADIRPPRSSRRRSAPNG